MKHNSCIGSGLVCLDILLRGNDDNAVSYTVGGTCGNVLMILSYMGWQSYPMARLDHTNFGEKLLHDLRSSNVCENFITTDNGKTPVIVQRNIIDKHGNPSHKFEILDKKKGRFHIDYSPVTKKQSTAMLETLPFLPSVFFFDRVNAANLQMAEYFREKDCLVYFEPSEKKVDDRLMKCVAASHIVKFADQRLKDVSFTEGYHDKLFIQTLGAKGLRYSLFGEQWHELPSHPNDKIVDSSGAGDWTSAMLIDQLTDKHTFSTLDHDTLTAMLTKAQKVASLSCSYEGARGLMFAMPDGVKEV